MARTESMSTVGSTIMYPNPLANVFGSYSRGTFSAHRPGHYYVELCAGANVGNLF